MEVGNEKMLLCGRGRLYSSNICFSFEQSTPLAPSKGGHLLTGIFLSSDL